MRFLIRVRARFRLLMRYIVIANRVDSETEAAITYALYIKWIFANADSNLIAFFLLEVLRLMKIMTHK